MPEGRKLVVKRSPRALERMAREAAERGEPPPDLGTANPYPSPVDRRPVLPRPQGGSDDPIESLRQAGINVHR